jgi:allophanate hydrolase
MAENIELFVVGAHLTGMALNKDLVALGAKFQRAVSTMSDYRFYALPNTSPPKPGMIFNPGSGGPGIQGEVWALRPDAFGTFVAAIPAPLGIGKVMLADGSAVSGFLCEAYAVQGAVEITQFGGWRAYMTSLK